MAVTDTASHNFLKKTVKHDAKLTKCSKEFSRSCSARKKYTVQHVVFIIYCNGLRAARFAHHVLISSYSENFPRKHGINILFMKHGMVAMLVTKN